MVRIEVEEIACAFDTIRAVGLVTAIREVLPTYQAAVREAGAPTFVDATVERATTAIADADGCVPGSVPGPQEWDVPPADAPGGRDRPDRRPAVGPAPQ